MSIGEVTDQQKAQNIIGLGGLPSMYVQSFINRLTPGRKQHTH
jgi:hypothetical protein